MLIKQHHFPNGSEGPNWGLILLMVTAAIGTGYLIYQAYQQPHSINPKNKDDERK